ncbi:hypothetical protein BS50DRAFT_472866, partial [Corynespora cassiicola Philippines]
KEADHSLLSNGKCWLGLFHDPVIVKDYPVLHRMESDTGLDVSLRVIPRLIQARRITSFDGKVFIKGFCAMLVLHKHTKSMFVWHMLMNKDGRHISYLDSAFSGLEMKDLDKMVLCSFGSARHIIGWCSNANSWAGKSFYKYKLHR